MGSWIGTKREEEVLDKRYLVFDQLITRGVVYEEYENFEHSIFSDVYNKAFELVKKIVDENRKYQASGQESRLVDFEWEISNIISFIGRRGTGKTSALVSFGKALKECSEYTNFKLGIWGDDIGSISFYTLKCVNASMLEKTGDIFTLILANMVERILMLPRRETVNFDEYENRSILQKAGKIYDDYLTLKTPVKNINDGYSSLEKLKNIANSQAIRNNFAEFVQMYLERMNEANNRRGRGKESYLVISVDDIDVSRPSRKYAGDTRTGAYEIMYSLQQYFSVPNVIILVSYNHINLYNQTLEYFYTSSIQRGNDNTFEQKNAEELSSQFMEKTFPINMRLYMPSWRKRDFQNEHLIQIEVMNNPKNVLRNYQNEGKTRLSVKNFVLSLTGEKTGIYFDVEGRKKHFLEPDNLRSLCNFTEFLLSMRDCENISGNPTEWYECYKYNMNRLKEDIYFRYIREKLSVTSEMALMEEWLEDPIDRRSEKIVRLLSLSTAPLGKKAKEERDCSLLEAEREYEEYGDFIQLKAIEKRLNDNSRVAYSYAEFVHSIFHMTRDSHYYSRSMVGVLLYSYTVHLTETFQLYMWNKRRMQEEYYINSFRMPERNKELIEKNKEFHEEAEKHYNIIKNVIGRTVCGKWTEYFLPEMYTYSEVKNPAYGSTLTNPYIIGYVEKSKVNFGVKYEFNRGDLQCSGHGNQKGKSEFERQLSYFLFVAMQHTDLLFWTQESIECNLSLNEEKVDFRLSTYLPENTADLDLTSCFKYVFFYAEVFAHLEKIILGALEKNEQEL